jgi:DGQHR domain-containing protein
LAYDLFELAKARSPQKTSHNIAVALDRHKDSPLFQRIKRLGGATPGRVGEVLTQATVVEAVLPLISTDPVLDRDSLKRGRALGRPTEEQLRRAPLRPFFVDGRDIELLDVLWNYFVAVHDKWPQAWSNIGPGSVLPKTNGFRALMRAFKPLYVALSGEMSIPAVADYARYLEKVDLPDEQITIENFKPGTSGESALVDKLLTDMRLTPQKSLL